MLLSEAPDAPLKAIDFGLAVFFDPDRLPRTDLGLEGTPWFMAPEALSSAVWPASDVWSAGVLAYQLLSGKLPFDDRKPRGGAPALSAVWRSVLGDEPSFAGAAWAAVSAEARAFVAALLVKDPAQRPSAREALRHPWLQAAFHEGRARPLAATVVQRIQRFAQTDALRRTILELIAEELLKAAPLRLSPLGSSMHGSSWHGGGSAHGGGARGALAAAAAAATSPPSPGAAGSFGRAPSDAQLMFPMSPDRGGGGLAAAAATAAPAAGLRHSGSDASSTDAGARRGSLDARRGSLDLSVHGGSAGGSLHLGRSPSASALSVLARAAARAPEGSVHAPGEVLRALRAATAAGSSVHGRGAYSQAERAAARRASRLALDTSAHGGARYREFLERLERSPDDGDGAGAGAGAAALRGSRSMGQLSASAPPECGGALAMDAGAAEAPLPAAAFPEAAAPMEVDTGLEQGGRGRSAALAALLSGGDEAPAGGGGGGAPPPEAPAPAAARSASAELPPVKKVAFAPRAQKAAPRPALAAAAAAPAAEPEPEPAGPLTAPADLEPLMRQLRFRPGAPLSAAALADGLRALGYDLEPSEVAALLEALEPGAGGAALAPGRFVASQLDWAELPRAGAGAAEMWLECARAAFEGLDADSDGRVAPAELLAALRAKLPPDEVDAALEDALGAGGSSGHGGMDFDAFLRAARLGEGGAAAAEELDAYEPRLRRPAAPPPGEGSAHGRAALPSVPEHT
jgi:hypothetical protein